MAGFFGYFGQANYSSASAFLDAFVQYRQLLGQVASVIDIGPIEDDFIDIVQPAVAPESDHDPENSSLWKRDPRMAIYRNIDKPSAPGGDNDPLDPSQAFISSLRVDSERLNDGASSELLARAIALRLSNFLMKDKLPDISQTLMVMGVDSVVAIELRSWWKQALSVEVSVLGLMHGDSIQALGELATDLLKKKYKLIK
ncbi:KR domain-containing protein [Hirsutella rhossiliensis]|uniref:KR domain-containing protein n=1 Tax=Hirsutella rhossiliensis TaxID=111463 RepID=A0A9P8MT31_9HYPO|nr:KR domain-containing protein [Hirsutella rhossiliensis]KAH0960790.1 KR domain-containing protein [Hirsutella rhossiliensis]